jgi:dihydroneopterin aldolase/2-amino-4-hydroxy-6-hydroxymethyldihydropteridine diphosphokinase
LLDDERDQSRSIFKHAAHFCLHFLKRAATYRQKMGGFDSLRLRMMCCCIRIENFHCSCICGVSPDERLDEQELIIDMVVSYDCSECVCADDIELALDYVELVYALKSFIGRQSFHLLEPLGDAICRHIFARFKCIHRLDLSLRKAQPSERCGGEDITLSFSMVRALAAIGLGSNLGNRCEFLENAVKSIANVNGVDVLKQSSTHITAPLIVEDQPEFLNRSLLVETFLSPMELLREMQKIEDALGRVRSLRYGPRTIDIDLLLYEGVRSANKSLILPHPQIGHRRFWLEELSELGIHCTAADDEVWTQNCELAQ